MLHNSEPYGPHEAPTNAGVPVNKPQVGHPLNVAQNPSSLGKLGPNQHIQQLQQFIGPDFTAFDRQNHNTGTQNHNFANHSSTYVSRMSNPAVHSEYSTNAAQNGLLPYFDVHSDFNVNYHSSFPTKMYQKDLNASYNQGIGRDFPISIPQVPAAFPKHLSTNTEDTNSYVNNINYFNKEKVSITQNVCDSNVNMSLDDKERLKIKVESTVKHIEHIIKLDQSNKLAAANRPKESSQNSATKDEKKLDKVPEIQNNQQKDVETNKNMKENVSTEPTEMSEDRKPTEEVTKIFIKVEDISWTDTEYENPFVQDINALTKDSILNVIRDKNHVTKDSVMNVNIIAGETSVEEAVNVVKSDVTPPACYYECPHCSILHEHPKRFLVHVKWHSFGLTNSKRLAKAEARVVRKAVRSGEVLDANEHDPSGNFPCKDCDKVFSRNSALKTHRVKAHKAAPRDCRVCARSFPDWKELRAHHASEHPPGQRLTCTHCQKTFKYKHTLTKHSQTHFEKTFACEQCPKKFGTDQLLRAHERSHERHLRDPAHHCSYCGKGFFERHNLRVHEKTHVSDTLFTCEICNSSFKTNGSLKRHTRVSHSKSKSKPYECSTCHRCFATSIIRDRHEQRLHGNQDKFRITCVKCKRNYRTEKELQQHTCRRPRDKSGEDT